MKTIIEIINIPSNIFDNVRKSYTIKDNLDINIGESLIIQDYIQRRVYLDCSIFNNENISHAYTYEKLGNKIDLEFDVKDIQHNIYIEDYDSDNITEHIKYIKVEFTKKTIDIIKQLVEIDKNVSQKSIDFGDNQH